MSAPSLSPAAAPQTSALFASELTPSRSTTVMPRVKLACAFDRDPVPRPGKADRAVERDRHRGRIGEREADLAGLDAIGLARAAVRLYGELRLLRAQRLDLGDLGVAQDGWAARDVPADHFDLEPRAEDGARRLRIDPDVVFRRRRHIALAARRAAHHHAAADLRRELGIARQSASAILVSGPSVTSVRPGSSCARRTIASTACSRSGARFGAG